jgi:hypothetical protein
MSTKADHPEIKQRLAELVGCGNTHEEAPLAKGISKASVERILAILHACLLVRRTARAQWRTA